MFSDYRIKYMDNDEFYDEPIDYIKLIDNGNTYGIKYFKLKDTMLYEHVLNKDKSYRKFISILKGRKEIIAMFEWIQIIINEIYTNGLPYEIYKSRVTLEEACKPNKEFNKFLDDMNLNRFLSKRKL